MLPCHKLVRNVLRRCTRTAYDNILHESKLPPIEAQCVNLFILDNKTQMEIAAQINLYKCREQRRHMYSEMRNLDKTNFAVIKSTGKIVDPGALAKIKLPDVSSSMTEGQKKAACQALIEAWRNWEQSTVALYKQELAADPENKWLKCLMRDAEHELTRISSL